MALSNFSWIIPYQLAGSGIPGNGSEDTDIMLEDIKKLSSYGIKFLVSLQNPPVIIDTVCKQYEIERKYFPIPDFGIPANNQVFGILVNEIIEKMKKCESVCVHCQAGVGRTGLVLSCVIGKWFALDGIKAISAVRRTRSALETKEQEQFVLSFLEEYEH